MPGCRRSPRPQESGCVGFPDVRQRARGPSVDSGTTVTPRRMLTASARPAATVPSSLALRLDHDVVLADDAARRGSVQPGSVCGDRPRTSSAVTTSMSTAMPGTVPAMGEERVDASAVDPGADAAVARPRHPRASSSRARSRSCWSRSSGSCCSPSSGPRSSSATRGSRSWRAARSSRTACPQTETLTVLGQGATWTDQQWLAQVVFYGAHELAGMRAVVVLDVLLVVLALGLTAAAARAGGASSRSTFVVGLLAVLAGPWGWTIRAQTAALPLFAGVLWLLARRLAAGVRRRTLLVLPALVLWANLHGSVVLGAGLTVLLAAYALVRDRVDSRGCSLRAPGARSPLHPRDAVRLGHRRLLRPDARGRPVRGDPARVAVVEPERDHLPLLRPRARRRCPRRAPALSGSAERLRAARPRGHARRRRAGGARRDLVRARRAAILPLALDGLFTRADVAPGGQPRHLGRGLAGLAVALLVTLARPPSWFVSGVARAPGRGRSRGDPRPVAPPLRNGRHRRLAPLAHPRPPGPHRLRRPLRALRPSSARRDLALRQRDGTAGTASPTATTSSSSTAPGRSRRGLDFPTQAQPIVFDDPHDSSSYATG